MAAILHISDLHRSPHDPITNAELVTSILNDLARGEHEEAQVPRPDTVVATGDIIQGVALSTPDYRGELRSQYDVAFEFFDDLARRLLDGDRSRIIMTNGNHDVDWNTAFSAMAPVARKDEPQDVAAELRRIGTPYRWCWPTRQVYRIVDRELYDRRFDAFRDFHARLYGGLPRLLCVRPEAEVNLFDLLEGRVAVAAFNSCFGNDCFALHGAIRPVTIAQTQLDLDDRGNYDLRIAVWHHSLQGKPYQTDYMDVELVQSMVGRGFRLGLHGHQHWAEVTPYSIQLPGKETMAVVSAGSLCAGRRELPVGVHRQYNVIAISDDLLHARIHVREMTVGTQFGPSRQVSFGGKSYVDIDWSPPADVLGRPVDAAAARVRARIEAAEGALASGDPGRAVSLLASMRDSLVGHGRRILVEAAVRVHDWDLLLRTIEIPDSADELATVVRANAELGRWAAARNAITNHAGRVNLPDPNRRDLEDWITAKETMAQ